MKRQLLYVLGCLVLLPGWVFASEIVTIIEAKAIDGSVKQACELAREKALLQAKQNQARLIRSQMTLVDSEQNGVSNETYQSRTDLYQMVEPKFVEQPETHKQVVGDQVECTVLNAKVLIDSSELENFKQTLASENKLRQTKLERRAQKLNGRDFHLKGVAHYEVTVTDPYFERNQQIKNQLVSLNNQAAENPYQATMKANNREGRGSNLQQSISDFQWHPALVIDYDMTLYSKGGNSSYSEGAYGLNKVNEVYVGDAGLGLRFFPGNENFGFYVGVGEEEWAICNKVTYDVCSGVDEGRFSIGEMGGIVKVGPLSFQVNQVTVFGKERMIGAYQVPERYYKWFFTLTSNNQGYAPWRLNLGGREILNIPTSSREYVLGIGIFFQL